MDTNIALLLVAGLVLATLLLGWGLHATRTRIRRLTRAGSAEPIEPGQLAATGEAPPTFGSRLTLVQFSTETCARCPASARTLAAAAGSRSGVRHVEIDVTGRDDLIGRFSIMRTPTVLVVDERHRLRARVSGPVSAAQTAALVDEYLATTGSRTEQSLA